MDDSDIIESFLPLKYKYKILSCEKVETASLPFDDVYFDLKVRVNVNSVEGLRGFLSDLSLSEQSNNPKWM